MPQSACLLYVWALRFKIEYLVQQCWRLDFNGFFGLLTAAILPKRTIAGTVPKKAPSLIFTEKSRVDPNRAWDYGPLC